MSTRLSSPKEYEELLDKYDTWMFDCDGVLWSGDKSIEGAIEVLDILRSRSMSTIQFLDSNCTESTATREKGSLCHEQRHEIAQEVQEEIR